MQADPEENAARKQKQYQLHVFPRNIAEKRFC